jgi:hypothetical protein
MIPALLGIASTLVVSAFGAAIAYGRSTAAAALLEKQVEELRGTCARTLERMGAAEAALREVLGRLDEQRELSGRVRT